MPGGGPSNVVVVADEAHDSRLLYDVNGLKMTIPIAKITK